MTTVDNTPPVEELCETLSDLLDERKELDNCNAEYLKQRKELSKEINSIRKQLQEELGDGEHVIGSFTLKAYNVTTVNLTPETCEQVGVDPEVVSTNQKTSKRVKWSRNKKRSLDEED